MGPGIVRGNMALNQRKNEVMGQGPGKMQHLAGTSLETKLPRDHCNLGSWPPSPESPSLRGGIRGPASGPLLALFFAFDRVPEVSSKSPDLFSVAEGQ